MLHADVKDGEDCLSIANASRKVAFISSVERGRSSALNKVAIVNKPCYVSCGTFLDVQLQGKQTHLCALELRYNAWGFC